MAWDWILVGAVYACGLISGYMLARVFKRE
jgi:hypothetical protein